jgi:hypothetical protein
LSFVRGFFFQHAIEEQNKIATDLFNRALKEGVVEMVDIGVEMVAPLFGAC